MLMFSFLFMVSLFPLHGAVGVWRAGFLPSIKQEVQVVQSLSSDPTQSDNVTPLGASLTDHD